MSAHHEDSQRFRQRTIYILLVLVLLLAFGLRVARIHTLGTHVDEGNRIAMGKLLYEGKVLYRDVLANKPPGVFWLVASIFYLTKPSIFFPRLASVLSTTLTCLMVYLIGKKSANTTTGLVAALFFALDPLNIFWSRFVMTEQFTALLVTTSVYAFIRAHQTQSKLSFFLAGLLTGWASLMKQPAFVVLGAFFLFLILDVLLAPRKSVALKAAALSWCVLVGGLILAYVPALLLLQARGVLAEYIYFSFVINEVYVGRIGRLQGKLSSTLKYALTRPALIMAWLSIPLIFMPGDFGGRKEAKAHPSLGKAASNHRTNHPARLLALWAILDWLFLAYAPRGMEYGLGGFSHYILLLTPSTSLLAAIFVHRCLTQLAKGATTRKLKEAFFQHEPLVLLLLITLGLLLYPPFSADLVTATWTSTYPSPDQSQERAVGEYIKSITSPGDGILVFSNAIIYYWADRVPTNRYGTHSTFFEIWQGSPSYNDGLWEIARALENKQTKAVVVRRPYLQKNTLPLPITTPLRKEFELDQPLKYSYHDNLYILTRRPISDPLSPIVFPSRDFVNIQYPMDVAFGEQLLLAGYTVHEPSAKRGERLHVSLFWEPLKHWIVKEHTAFVHLRDQANRTVAQNDRPLFNNPSLLTQPRTELWRYRHAWHPGEILREIYELNLPADLPPGEYQLRTGLYVLSTLERVPIVNDTSGENAVVLSTITVGD